MPCSCDHYNDNSIERQHRLAARVHVKLLEMRGEEVTDEFRNRANGTSTAELLNGNEVETLCAFLKELGGAEYTAQLILADPSNRDAAEIHSWWIEHEKWDIRRERELAMAQFRLEQDAAYRRLGESRRLVEIASAEALSQVDSR